MKHLFYVIYITSYSLAVLISGMFIGQALERAWLKKERQARLKETEAKAKPIGAALSDATEQ